MSLFSKLEITEKDNVKINSLLPKEYQKDKWGLEDLVEVTSDGYNNLYKKFRQLVNDIEYQIKSKKSRLNDLNENIATLLAPTITIFNCNVYNAKPLGMVDIGIVSTFNTTSTGNRFENGLIGYAIEGVLDNVWANSNIQFEHVQNAKLDLLKKAIHIYPDTNVLYNFQIDFRELGSSGNVFLYLRGTACVGENLMLLRKKDELNNEREEIVNLLPNLESNLTELRRVKGIIPKTKGEVKRFLKSD